MRGLRGLSGLSGLSGALASTINLLGPRMTRTRTGPRPPGGARAGAARAGAARAGGARKRPYAPHRDRTVRRTVVLWPAVTLAVLGALFALSAVVHRLVRIEAAVSLPLLGLVLVGARQFARRAARERAESERRLREFLCAAGHELRNPLTTISGYAELARTGTGPSYELMRQDALGRVATEVRRMDSLIDELVFLSHLDLGQPLELRRVDLARLCRDAVAAERDCHPGHRVRLLVAPGEHTVTGDPLRLHQVVANLLTNARVHTPEGTTTTLGLGTEDGRRVIEVTDDGPGVPDELRARIFDRFVRGEETRVSGSGLGLSIVAAVAAAHGGSVTLEPSDRGAWFRVRLPAPS